MSVDDEHGGVDVEVVDGVVAVRFWGSVDLAVRRSATCSRRNGVDVWMSGLGVRDA